jgi:pilus assembly protein FimV
MPIQRHWRLLFGQLGSGGALLLATAVAQAAGFGSNASGAVLGQPLDFVVQVRLDAGEVLAPECVSAEVTAGEQRLQPGNVRTVLEAQTADTARVRVQTTQALDEPVIGVNLTVGCTAKLTRRFVVLADPPGLGMGAAPAVALAPVPTVAAAGPGASSAAAATGTAAAPAGTPASGAAVRATPARNGRSAVASAAPRAAARVARPVAKRAAPVVAAPSPAPAAAPAGAPTPIPTPAVAAAPAPSNPRLRLDFAEPPPSSGPAAATATAATAAAATAASAAAANAAVEQALSAVAQAASAARSAATAASAAADRITGLERTVEQLRSEAKSSRDVTTQLRDRLAQTDGPDRWTVLLMTLAGLLAALSAWLAWRLGRAQGQRQQGWSQAMSPDAQGNPATAAATLAASRLPTGAMPFSSTVEPTLPPLSGHSRPGRSSVPAWPPASPAQNSFAPYTADSAPPDTWPPKFTDNGGQEGAVMRTQPHPRHAVDLEVAARDVSIEELIDLEQQAEFFVVLGQDDAAIDLLVDHLRSTGGSSPLPYLKLLEIYRRRGDHPAYERMRARFNHRFNAYAPDWDTDLLHGRSLDDYASVMPRLLQVWPRPLDAMAELEALLFRKSRGELFDLPAYREVLFLYSLARDLLDRESADTGSVDLLLPLADGGEFSSTAPAPFASDTQIREGRMDYDDRPTAPVDFDLTQPPPQISIFEEEPMRPRRR